MASLLKHLDKIVFFLGISVIVFLYGTAVGKYELPPYRLIDGARDAAVALRDHYFGEEPRLIGPYDRGGLLHSEPDKVQPGSTLIAARGPEGSQAWLIDVDGNTLHEWRILFSEVWPQAPHLVSQGPDDKVIWHGIHLYPNGDLLFNFEGSHFPFGAGLVMLDKDSQVKWALEQNTHHDLQVREDGTIFVVAHNYNEAGVTACNEHLEAPYYEDTVLIVSAEGDVRDEISILEAMCTSDFRALFTVDGWRRPVRLRNDDPLHTNAIDIVTPEIASRFPFAQTGDILLSFRDISTIALLDPETRKITWANNGLFIRQHDPDFLDNGNLLVFDNLGSRSPGGPARLIEFNPLTQEVVWVFEGNGEIIFRSETQGSQQPLPNGNIMIADSYGGRAIEVTRGDNPEIVWEYVNYLEPHEQGSIVGLVTEARKYEPGTLTFLEERPTS